MNGSVKQDVNHVAQVPPRPGAKPQGWVDEHGDVLFRYALLRVRNKEDAEELVQETLLAALRNVSQYRGGAAERTWLIGILRHKIIDHIGRSAVRAPGPDVCDPTEGDAPPFDARGRWRMPPAASTFRHTDKVTAAEFWSAFYSCLSQLPAGQGAAFALRELEQMESPGICQVLGVTSTNLWTLLHRARMGLRTCLETKGFGGKSRTEAKG